MIKLIAALILSLSGVVSVVYFAPRSSWGAGGNGAPGHGNHMTAPEIDPSSAITALTLLLGGVTVLRSRVATKK
jgi:hypothetical protein